MVSELEKFVLRWQRIRPKETDLVDGGYTVIDNNLTVLKEKREEWNQLSENIKKIRYDLTDVGIYFVAVFMVWRENCRFGEFWEFGELKKIFASIFSHNVNIRG